MTRPRSEQISLKETPFYHCYSRCVRRAFLCGKDKFSGRCFEHRRKLLEKRLLDLAAIFTIDILSYAIMSNHYHLVLRIDKKTAESLSQEEVVQRWCKLCKNSFKGYPLAKRYLNGDNLTLFEQEELSSYVIKWQNNLSSLSWFMRNINEYIARVCNQEDNCTGHFWESRFKCQALLDEKALLTCMAYVDLNPIRACEAKRLEDSKFTSIFHRIRGMKKEESMQKNGSDNSSIAVLFPFSDEKKAKYSNGLNFYLSDYLELVSWSAKQIVPGKKGYIAEKSPPILNEIGMNEKNWLYLANNFDSTFKGIVGMYHRLKEACRNFGSKRSINLKAAKAFFDS